MPKVTRPQTVIARMLADCGEKLSGREVAKAAKALGGSTERIAEMERALQQNGDAYIAGGAFSIGNHLATERQQLQRAADLLERIGAGETLHRYQNFPESLSDSLETVPVTPKARGVAATHGALLQAFLAADPASRGD